MAKFRTFDQATKPKGTANSNQYTLVVACKPA